MVHIFILLKYLKFKIFGFQSITINRIITNTPFYTSNHIFQIDLKINYSRRNRKTTTQTMPVLTRFKFLKTSANTWQSSPQAIEEMVWVTTCDLNLWKFFKKVIKTKQIPILSVTVRWSFNFKCLMSKLNPHKL